MLQCPSRDRWRHSSADMLKHNRDKDKDVVRWLAATVRKLEARVKELSESISYGVSREVYNSIFNFDGGSGDNNTYVDHRISSDQNTSWRDLVGAWRPLSGSAQAFAPRETLVPSDWTEFRDTDQDNPNIDEAEEERP